MQIIADLHIHSRFSRATSRDITVNNLERWARIKGLSVLGTADFTHPKWFSELKENLVEEEGILRTKTNFPFILETEISLMFKQKEKMRRIHLLILAPSFEVVEQINDYLRKKGRLDYDGRPTFGLTACEFVEAMKEISDAIEIIPAHIWTPWYGLLGSKSGFDSFEEAFEDQVKKIYAFETGLSSDPAMNWRVSFLDDYTILSFSDSHSLWPWRLGREATIFELKELSYKNMVKAIRTREGYKGTIEVEPAYGKYHFDGHRFCNFSCKPKEAIEKYNNICPVCKKPLTIGVLHRVEELADRPEGFKPKNAFEFKTILPLHEIIAKVLNTVLSSKRVWNEYEKLVNAFNNEFNVLLEVPFEKLRKVTKEKIALAIIKNREGKIKIKPGFDGKYGEIILEQEKQKLLPF